MGPRTTLTVGSYSSLERDALERLFSERTDGGITVYLAESEPLLPDLTITIPPKMKNMAHVGRGGSMPIPSGKRKKFKPSRQRRRK